MRTIIACIVILSGCITANAQQYDTRPPYLRTKMLPAFTLLNTDSAAFNQSVISKGKPVIIMLFNPECGHCKDQLKLMLTMPEITNGAQLIMATTETLGKIKAFSDAFGLGRYPDIHLGKDRKSFFGGYFQPRTIPVLAFYDKNGRFVAMHQGNVKKKQMLQALR